jgi:hypothetical protein
VREVQASNIHASTHELLELLFAAGRWTDRTDNFGASHRFSSQGSLYHSEQLLFPSLANASCLFRPHDTVTLIYGIACIHDKITVLFLPLHRLTHLLHDLHEVMCNAGSSDKCSIYVGMGYKFADVG